MKRHESTTKRRATTPTTNSKDERKPFADLTNSHSLQTLKAKSISPPLQPIDGPAVDSRSSEDDLGDPSVTASTPRSKDVGSVGDGLHQQKLEMSVTYVRCKASSCPPAARVRDIKGKRILEDANRQQQNALSVPCQKPKKKQRHITKEAKGKPILPQDFVEKQQAYFAEVDAFELPVEEVSVAELD